MGSTPTDETLYSIGQAAKAVGRVPRTLRRWEAAGLIAPPRRVRGQRMWSQADIEKMRQAVEDSGFMDTSNTESVSVTAWAGLEEPETVTPWAQLSGDSPPQAAIKDLPADCPTCHRTLMVSGITNQFGVRLLVASCEWHGEQGKTRWT